MISKKHVRAPIALLLFFFVSGFIALVYQVAWQKVLTQAIGVDAYSIALIVSIFMLGLGIGGYAGGALTQQKRIHVIVAYGIFEASLGLYGILSVWMLRVVNAEILSAGGGYALQFFVNLALLFIPTFFMGLTLPLIAHAYRNIFSIGTLVGTVYSANVVGAAVGALTAGLVLIGTIGISATVIAMGVLNIALSIAICAYLTHAKKNVQAQEIINADVADCDTTTHLPLRTVSLLSLICGFAALSYEIVFFRIFTAYFGATTYVFSILLASYLVMMALGNYFFGKLADRCDRTLLFFVASVGTVVSGLLALFGHTALNAIGIDSQYLVLWHLQTWISYAQIPVIFIISLIFMLPIAFVSGFFPLIVASAGSEKDTAGRHIGNVYCVQTFGNFAGSLVAGLLLLPILGTIWTLIMLGAFILLVPFIHAGKRIVKCAASARICIIIAAGSLMLYPHDFYQTIWRTYRDSTVFSQPQKPLTVKEGLSGVTLAYPSPDNDHLEVFLGRMFSNSVYTSSSKTKRDCFPWNIITRIHGFAPKRALYIGLGTGNGPLCIREYFPGISIDIVELNSELIELMNEVGSNDTKTLLRMSRTVISDGRRFIQTNRESYDLIQVGTFGAWCSGCGNLFTEEFFQIVAQRLNHGGILTYNSYPSAVQAGIFVFDSLNVLSRGSGVADVVARKEEAIVFDKKGQHPFDNPTLDKSLQSGCVISRDQAFKRTSHVERQTDDKPITELYLTANQYMYAFDRLSAIHPPRDMRDFKCEKNIDQPLTSLLE